MFVARNVCQLVNPTLHLPATYPGFPISKPALLARRFARRLTCVFRPPTSTSSYTSLSCPAAFSRADPPDCPLTCPLPGLPPPSHRQEAHPPGRIFVENFRLSAYAIYYNRQSTRIVHIGDRCFYNEYETQHVFKMCHSENSRKQKINDFVELRRRNIPWPK